MKKIRIGIVGCGWFGNFHLDYLLTREDVEVVALVSTNHEKLENTAKKAPHAQLFCDYHALLETPMQLDCLIVCIPPHKHDDLEIAAAKKGIHLYVEKPIGLSLEKVHTIQSAIENSGIITSVGYHERYNPAIVQLKDALSLEQVGLVQGRWLGDIPGALWWRQKAFSGGQVVEQSTHIVDLFRYLFGEVKSVYAQKVGGLVKDLPKFDVDDATSALITFESGVVANLMTGCYFESDSPSTGVQIEFLCKHQKITYRWMQDVTYEKANETVIKRSSEESHHMAMAVFIDALQTGNRDQIRSGYSDSMKTLAVTLAINDSLEQNKPIMLSV